MGAKLLLFDIDGTLMLSGGAGQRAMLSAGQSLFGESFRFDVNTAGKIDTQIFAEAVALNKHLRIAEHHETFRDAYLDYLGQDLAKREAAHALPGVHSLLSVLRKRSDITLGLLTGNYTQAVPIKLRAVNIEPSWFPVTSFGDEAETRPALVPVALKKYERLKETSIAPNNVIVIGDTPRDVDCARANSCVAGAVATGRYSYTDLFATNADLVLENLSDASPLLELLDQTD